MRDAVASPIDDTAVLVTMRRDARGPWAVVSDIPSATRPMIGPPPGFLALAGVGSCTIVTVAGVASRGESDLRGMRVAFDVTERERGGVAIRQRTTLEGDLTDTDRLRLGRAIQYCPVGKNFTKRGLAITDAVTVRGATRGGDRPTSIALPASVDIPVFLPGTVKATYLPETQEWLERDGRRTLDQEGEVKIHVRCAPGGMPERHWGYLGGHSSAGWAPRPSAWAMGSLAASTVMTLRALSDQLQIDPGTIRVTVSAVSAIPTGGKRVSQDAAAEGVAQQVHWRRTASVETSSSASRPAIARAMSIDPIYGICMRGDLLAGDEVEVVPGLRAMLPETAGR